MSVRRAFVMLLFLVVAGGAAVGSAAVTGKKHVKGAQAKSAAKTAGKGRRAPAAKFGKTAKAGRAKRGRGVTVAHARGETHSRTAHAAVVHAEVLRPAGGREATIERITQELASTKVGIENPEALGPFFEQLRQLEQDPKGSLVRVIQFGDSHTAADIFTGAMRSLFQTKFGDGGAGFQFAGYPFAGYRIHGTKRAQSTGWTVEGTHLRDIGDGLVGMGGISLSTDGAGNWVSVDADANVLEVQYLLQPGGGHLEIYDGDLRLATVSTDGPEGAGHFELAVQGGSHHFEVRTIDEAPVRLLGLVTENTAGVTYEAAGINGAEASLFLRWNEGLQQTLMATNAPALIVLSYGTNEAGDHNWTEESYAALFRQIIARCHRLAPKAAILVVGPPDRALRAGRRGWAPFAGVDRIVQAQRSVCRELGCAYWDQRRRMGGFGSMRDWVSVQWAQGDHTHFTVEGYDELASAMFSDIVQQYNAYQGPAQGVAKAAQGDGQ
jgi:lysophospholipase L1-like esterase